jgi:hypothetical protein
VAVRGVAHTPVGGGGRLAAPASRSEAGQAGPEPRKTPWEKGLSETHRVRVRGDRRTGSMAAREGSLSSSLVPMESRVTGERVEKLPGRI